MNSRILVIDNYDSFTYNLVHIIRELGHTLEVFRNDKIKVEEVSRYDKIMLSPGPGIPDEAGVMKQIIAEYAATKSILGVCLGHQGIAEVFGAKLQNIPKVLHGVTSEAVVMKSDERLFRGLPGKFRVTHYHSWAVIPESITGDLEVTAENREGIVLALAHRKFDVKGVQFHPESIMTEHGTALIRNWLDL